MTTNEIYRGYEITLEGAEYIIKLGGETMCSTPSMEAAYQWIDDQHRARLDKAMKR